MSILAGNCPAHRGGVDADLLGNFFDHHRLELVYAFIKKIALPSDDRVTDFKNGLFALFNILDQLDRRFISFLDVIAHVFLGRIPM